MQIGQEQLDELREIVLNEYGVEFSEEDLLSEAIRLSEFAKTVARSSLLKTLTVSEN